MPKLTPAVPPAFVFEHEVIGRAKMIFWTRFSMLFMAGAIAGCAKSIPSETNSNVSAAKSQAKGKDDPFSDPTNAVASTDKSVDFDSLTKLIDDTIGKEVGEEKRVPFSPPLTSAQTLDALQQCVHHALTHPDLMETRDFYGTRGDADIVLVNDGPVKWPDGLLRVVEGWRLRFASQTTADAPGSDRKLGIRLDKLDLLAPSSGFLDGNITLTLTNVGGGRNGLVMGGCLVFYRVRKDGDKVVATCAGSLDP
jgi:hypothetical protein